MGDHTHEIADLLHRRTDLSTFVVHFTRQWVEVDGDGDVADWGEPDDNLVAFLGTGLIQARSSQGLAKSIDARTEWARQSQRVVCFSEVPLEHAYSVCCSIANRGVCRSVELAPYGLAFPKYVARQLGVNPVWYLDATPGHDWLTKPVERLVKAAEETGFHGSDIAALTPFMEVMGTWDSSQREFWWEREWRHRGDFHFKMEQVVVGLCPQSEIPLFEAKAQDRSKEDGSSRWPRFVDPTWGLERMIAHLTGFSGRQVSPFET